MRCDLAFLLQAQPSQGLPLVRPEMDPNHAQFLRPAYLLPVQFLPQPDPPDLPADHLPDADLLDKYTGLLRVQRENDPS